MDNMRENPSWFDGKKVHEHELFNAFTEDFPLQY